MLDLDQLHTNINALDKGDDASRRKAIRSLRHLEQHEWITAPTAVLHSLVLSLQRQLICAERRPFMHKELVTILGNLGPRSKSAVPQLIQLLQEGTPDSVRETAATALGKFGGEARDAVDQLIVLSTGQTVLAVQAVRALGAIGCADHRVRSALVNLWLTSIQSHNGQVHLAIALCKLRIDAKGLLEFLTNNLLASRDEFFRKSAAEALAWCGKNETDVVPALLAATLGDSNEEVRQMAQAALDQLHLSREKAIRLCASQLDGSSFAETALRKSGPLAVPVLIEALGEETSAIRVKAARILGCLGDMAAEAVPALTTALQDRDSDIRLAAAKGLWNITKNAEVVVPVLVHLLEKTQTADFEDSECRRRFLQTVIEALWRIGPPAKASVPALFDKTKDENRLVSESARNALRRIAPAAVDEAVCDATDHWRVSEKRIRDARRTVAPSSTRLSAG